MTRIKLTCMPSGSTGTRMTVRRCWDRCFTWNPSVSPKVCPLFRQTNRMPISRPLSGSARKWARSMRLRSRRTATRFMSVMSCRLWVRNKRRFRRKNSGKNRDVFYCGSSARNDSFLLSHWYAEFLRRNCIPVSVKSWLNEWTGNLLQIRING